MSMKYKGKYSISENIYRGRGMGLLSEGGDTTWGGGWASEVTATKHFGGTLKSMHLDGKHQPGGNSKSDIDIPGGEDKTIEVKQYMPDVDGGKLVASAGHTICPIEITVTRANKMDAASLAAQLKRYAVRGIGTLVQWKPGVYDAEAGSSTPGEDTMTPQELQQIGAQLDQALNQEFYCVSFEGGQATIYDCDMSKAKAIGIIPYYTQDRPAVAFEVPLGTGTSAGSTEEIYAWFQSKGGKAEADSTSPLVSGENE